MAYDIEVILKEMTERYSPMISQYPNINFYALLKGIVRHESNFNAMAENDERIKFDIKDNSIGLAQIMIPTARGISARLGASLNNKTNEEVRQLLFDGRYNLYLAGKYIVEQILRYSGNMRLMISAYNAGSAMFRINGSIIYYDEKGFFKSVKNSLGKYVRVNVSGYDVNKINEYEIWNKDYVNLVSKYYLQYNGNIEKKTP